MIGLCKYTTLCPLFANLIAIWCGLCHKSHQGIVVTNKIFKVGCLLCFSFSRGDMLHACMHIGNDLADVEGASSAIATKNYSSIDVILSEINIGT